MNEYNFSLLKNKCLSFYYLATSTLHFCFEGYMISVDPSFPVGKRNVRIECSSAWYELINEVTLDIRQNKNEDFISVIKCNESGIHRLNNETIFESVTLVSYSGICSNHYYDNKYIRLIVSLQSDKCTIDAQTSASTRCLFFNGDETFNSSERNIYSIEGIQHLLLL